MISDIEFDPNMLQNALDEADLSQAEFSRMLGYKHRNVLNKIIKGSREATANDLLKFSIVLKKTPKDFCKVK